MKQDTTTTKLTKRAENMAEHVKLKTHPEATEENLWMKACVNPNRIHDFHQETCCVSIRIQPLLEAGTWLC